MNVFLKDPDVATYFEGWFWEMRGVDVLSLCCLNVAHLRFEGGMKLFQNDS